MLLHSHGCSWLPLAAPGSSWLFLAAHGSFWPPLATHGSPWLLLALRVSLDSNVPLGPPAAPKGSGGHTLQAQGS